MIIKQISQLTPLHQLKFILFPKFLSFEYEIEVEDTFRTNNDC